MVKTYRTVQQWDQWLAQSVGVRILEAEQNLLARIYAEQYGKQAVLIGVPRQYELLKSTIIPNHVVITPLINKHAPIQTIESDFYHLPIIPGSIDLVILPHTLEFIDNPHQLLVEACRIVKPEGVIIILGFNPFSLWGLKKYLEKSKNIPWNGNFMSVNKLVKWLQLADFQMIQQETMMFRPPITQEKIFQKLQFLEWVGHKCFAPFGGVYALKAKAKIAPLIPIKLHWRQKLSPIPVTLPGPTMRDRQ